MKIFANLQSRESKQVMAVIYLEVNIESLESELVPGNSLLTGVANELHLLGRKNHPQRFKQLEAYNEAKKRDENCHLDFMKETRLTDNLALTKLVDTALPFMAILDPIVEVWLFLEDIFTLKDITLTLLFLSASSLCVIFFELALAMLPVALALYILSNAYYMKRYKVAKPNITRTAGFILNQMEQGIAARPKVDRLVSDIVFWGKPNFTLLVI
jgi:hypothetical protein